MKQSDLLWTIRDSQRLVAVSAANPTLLKLHREKAQFFLEVYEKRKTKSERNARERQYRQRLKARKAAAAEAEKAKGPLW